MTDKKTEKICIFTDSASDITHEEAERWDVKVAPLQPFYLFLPGHLRKKYMIIIL